MMTARFAFIVIVIAVAIASVLCDTVFPSFPPRFPPHQRQVSPIRFAGSASIRGRRPYQEDRLLCTPSISIPYANESSASEAALFGVFDGHQGHHASDFAASFLTEHFLSVAFGMIQNGSRHLHPSAQNSRLETSEQLPDVMTAFYRRGLNLQKVLQEALNQSILDIDSDFHQRAREHNLKAGSTACVALVVDDQILVANVGDSKALLCSSCVRKENSALQKQLVSVDSKTKSISLRRQRYQMQASSFDTGNMCVTELSSDHRPDRPEERHRIEAAGGFITMGSSLSRVNGQLAVSRSIGDIDFKRFGVISEPEFSGWHHVSSNGSYLVLASDGVFERMGPLEVCNLLHAVESGQNIRTILDRIDHSPVLAPLPLPGIATDLNSEAEHQVLESAMPENFNTAVDACMEETSERTLNMLAAPLSSSGPHIGRIMAQILVEVADLAGSMDNLSAVVVPLKHLVS